MQKIKHMVAAVALLMALPALAASLGSIEVRSALNEPFMATIPISGVAGAAQGNLNASMGSEAAFQRAGLRKDALYNTIALTVVPGSNGNAQILLTSDKRIDEPFMSFIVNLSWSGGSVQREYTVLLDPPNYANDAKEPPASPAPASTRSVKTQAAAPVVRPVKASPPADKRVREVSTTPAQPRSSNNPSVRHYGPTVSKETLWSIAYALRRDPSIDMDQMLLAIYRANPEDFEGSINRMYKGAMLTIPDAASIRAINPARAKAEIARQTHSQPAAKPAPRHVAKAEPKPKPEPKPAAEPAPTPQPEPADTAAPQQQAQSDEQSDTSQAAAQPAASKADQQTPPAIAPGAAAASQPIEPAPTGAADDAAAKADASAEATDSLAAQPADAKPSLDKPSIWVTDSGEKAAAPAADAAQGAQADAASTEAAAPVQGAQPVPAKPAPKAAAPAPSEGGFMAQLQNLVAGLGVDLKYVLLGLLALLAALFGYSYYRKRKHAQAEVEAAHMSMPAFQVTDLESPAPADRAAIWEQEQDASAAAQDDIQQPSYAPAAEDDALIDPDSPTLDPAMVASEEETYPVRETDYLGEAELHIAYGLYDEAAAVLERGVEDNPQRGDLWVKLVEVYADAGKSDDVVSTAQRFQQHAQPSDAQWKRVCMLGASLAPTAAIFASAAVEAETPEPVNLPQPPAASHQPHAESPAEPPAAIDLDAQLDNGDMLEFDADDNFAPAATAATPAPASLHDDAAVDFDMDELELDQGHAAPSASEPSDEQFDIDLSDFDTGDATALSADDIELQAPTAQPAAEGIELDAVTDLESAAADMETSRPQAAPKPEPAAAADSDAELAAVDSLDDFIAGSPAAAAQPEVSMDSADEIEAPAGDDESGVKLDLARAYIDMGEQGMARSLLEEVQRSGTAEQRKEASEQLDRM